MTAPHSALKYARPDEVAECWDDVPMDLYRALWACEEGYTGPTPEESEEPIVGLNSVADFWDRFTDDEKAKLNELAEARDAWLKGLTAG